MSSTAPVGIPFWRDFGAMLKAGLRCHVIEKGSAHAADPYIHIYIFSAFLPFLVVFCHFTHIGDVFDITR